LKTFCGEIRAAAQEVSFQAVYFCIHRLEEYLEDRRNRLLIRTCAGGVIMKFLLFLSEAMVPLMIFYIVGFGLLSGRPVLDDFIDGAKDGMKTVAGIFPTLAGLMVSVGIIRSSGFLDFLGEVLAMPAAL